MTDISPNTLCAHFELADQELDKVISDLHLDDIAQTRCTYWKFLSSRLRLQDVVAKDIDKDFPTESEKRREFFQQWKQRKGSEATYRSLVKALLDINQRRDAEYVCNLLRQADASSSVASSGIYRRYFLCSVTHIALHTLHAGLQSQSTVADLTRYFPYLQASGTLSDERLTMLKERLYEETDKQKFKFGSLMFELQMDLEKRLSMDQVVDILVFYNKDFEGVFDECTTFSKVFRKVRDFVSFFDYDLLENLIDEHGSNAIKTKLAKYKDSFREFAKRRVTESPINAFDESDSCERVEVLVIVADKIIEDLTLDELKKFKRRINRIMGGKLVKVICVEGGSICITFRIFKDRNFIITEEQRQALQGEGVINITYGDHCFDMRPTIPGIATYHIELS